MLVRWLKLKSVFCVTTVLFCVSSCLGSDTIERPEKPNIVVIFIDDMGFADPGCFGNPLIKTPRIDQLAEEGIRLTNFYVNSPICSASRVAITTGQYQGRWKIHSFLNTRAGNSNRGMADFLDPSAPTTAKKLQAAGYATGHFGKWHMGGGRDVDDAPLPQAYGFDESLVSFEGLGDRIIFNPKGVDKARQLGRGKIIPCTRWERIGIQTDRTVDFIRRNKDRPFYVRLFPNDVHDRHEPIPGSAEKYATISADPYVRNFLAVLAELDRQIGRVIDEIDNLGLAEKTLIVFTSDNGPTDWPRKYLTGPPAGFAGPYRGRKWSLYEGGVRMPFIARWKGRIPEGGEDHQSIVSAIDLSPTICRFAGVPVESNLDGLDRGDVLLGKPSARSQPVFWQYGHPHAILKGGKSDHQSPTFAVREGRWKFLVNPDGTEAQLYDLVADESESHNLLSQQPERAMSMAIKIAEWASDVGFDYDPSKPLTTPTPTMAVLASNQLLRFLNHGVEGDSKALQFNGESWLDLPAFRAPKIAHGRGLQMKCTIEATTSNGVVFAHGDRENGFSVYLNDGQLALAICVKGKREIIQTEKSTQASVTVDVKWNANGEVFFRVNQLLVGRTKADTISREPADTIQIGADTGQPIGDYVAPNRFEGTIKNLSFKYPNGT